PSASLPCRVLVCLPTRRSSDLDAVQVLVGGLLVPQAAHQAAAAAADLGGVEGEALLLGHPDGDGLEVPQKAAAAEGLAAQADAPDRKSTRLNSSHVSISYAVFC